MTQMHATTVALRGRGLLILGPSGSGKSTLALQLMAVGARLVADDRTDLTAQGDDVVASCPAALAGTIEARGVGLLAAPPHGPVRLSLVVDLAQEGVARLPDCTTYPLLGRALPLVPGPYRSHLYAALRQYLLFGRRQ